MKKPTQLLEKGKRIYILDDDELFVSQLMIILPQLGYHVAGYASFPNASVEQITQTKPDLILLDDDRDASSESRRDSKLFLENINLPIVLLSANPEKSGYRDKDLSNVCGCLAKPIHGDQLRYSIEVACLMYQIRLKSIIDQELFENSPAALWVQDFSLVKALLDDLQSDPAMNIEEYILKNPEFIDECLQSVKVLDINHAGLEIYGLKKTEALNDDLSKYMTETGRAVFGRELIAIALGKTTFEFETDNYTKSGRRIYIHLKWMVYPGYENTLERCLISIEDKTQEKAYELILHTALEKSLNQVKRLQAMREIDRLITKSTQVNEFVDLLINQIAEYGNIDAAVLLFCQSWDISLLTLAALTGLPESVGEYVGANWEEQIAHDAILANEMVMNTWSRNYHPRNPLEKLLYSRFENILVFRLETKDRTIGLLELFNKTPFPSDEDWYHFMEAVAMQAAIGIENANLLNQMQLSHEELKSAYEATIRSWGRALELRNKEIEGHSQRVIELTLQIAKKLGIEGDELNQIRRGVYLHDIGKMAIPDHILNKPGPLDKEEWDVMRQHPIYASEILSEIPFLSSAMDIPRYHHERWDGSGYPYGLSGVTIPLAARIFAVVDVWDALTSDRPYRKAWTEGEALEYIIGQSGRLFDPIVVEIFVKIITQE